MLYNVSADYLIKIDDDNMLYKNKYKVSEYYYKKHFLHRDANSSIYIPKSIYLYDIFPSFVAGGFIIVNSMLIRKIYNTNYGKENYI